LTSTSSNGLFKPSTERKNPIGTDSEQLSKEGSDQGASDGSNSGLIPTKTKPAVMLLTMIDLASEKGKLNETRKLPVEVVPTGTNSDN
jgi:hypothetical protein